MRRWLRRLAIGPAHHDRKGGPFRIEDLLTIPREWVLAFRPALREDVRLTANQLVRGGLEATLEPFEVAFLQLCDGHNTVQSAIFDAMAPFSDLSPETAEIQALKLLAALATYDVISTGAART
jgi:hypothetical protein